MDKHNITYIYYIHSITYYYIHSITYIVLHTRDVVLPQLTLIIRQLRVSKQQTMNETSSNGLIATTGLNLKTMTIYGRTVANVSTNNVVFHVITPLWGGPIRGDVIGVGDVT